MSANRNRLVPAAIGAGLVGATVAGTRLLLHRQAAIARAAIGKPLGESALSSDRTWKKKHGDRIELLLLGDSIAAGLGAETPRQTPGARLARKLAKRTERAVRLHTAAVVGAETSDLAGQVASLPASYRPDVAVVVVGGNDVTHRVPVAESVRHLLAAVDALHERGAAVVVGTCPDLGALTAVPQPLRALGSRASRQLAAAQARAVEPQGAYVVSLAQTVGPFFRTMPEEMFSLDRFHPSSLGYKRTAQALLPAVEAALREGSPLDTWESRPVG
jgi:lysophospholipase L1-like esterase